ncbi:MAG: type secretion system protein [Micrococcaceae bacterium]|nr:type secretion system protein [Micrococcaceae bacterium]
MTEFTGPGIALGLVLGAGLWLVLVRLPVARRTGFAQRIEPQLRSITATSRLLHDEEGPAFLFGPLEKIARAVLRDVVGNLARFDLGTVALGKRLQQAGRAQTAIDFRAGQLLWGVAGLVAALVLVGGAVLAGTFSVPVGLGVVAGLTAGGFLAKDYLLTLQIQRRSRRMLAEFPALAELMALAVGAGESAAGAMERICRSSDGELAKEFRLVLFQTRSGTPLVDALGDFSRRVQVAPLVRFVDGIIVAVQRGTPLAEVLRAQAQDVRDVAKRELMEAAGRKEIGMMVPLVFGVLPLTVIFAVFPGIAVLRLGF